jgi:hypothetical protein
MSQLIGRIQIKNGHYTWAIEKHSDRIEIVRLFPVGKRVQFENKDYVNLLHINVWDFDTLHRITDDYELQTDGFIVPDEPVDEYCNQD